VVFVPAPTCSFHYFITFTAFEKSPVTLAWRGAAQHLPDPAKTVNRQQNSGRSPRETAPELTKIVKRNSFLGGPLRIEFKNNY
jgi:hypothetical protein